MDKKIDRSNSVKMYTNGFNINVGAYDVTLSLLNELRDPDNADTILSSEVALVSMSPMLAKTLVSLLGRLINDYEQNIGELPAVEKLNG